MSRTKSKAANVAVPQNREEAVETIACIGRRLRERRRIETAMNDEIATIKELYSEQVAPIDAAVRDFTRGVEIWAEANRQTLTDGGKSKTARLPSGEIKWRIAPPSVSLKGTEAIMEALRAAGLERFIRVKEEVSKEAILADPEAVRGIAGITIVQSEEIVIEPFEAELEEVL